MKFSDLSSKNKHPVQEDWQDVKNFGKEVGSGVVDVGAVGPVIPVEANPLSLQVVPSKVYKCPSSAT